VELDEPKVEVEIQVEINDLVQPKCVGISTKPLASQAITDDTQREISVSHLL
jgi:hypothetical protein